MSLTFAEIEKILDSSLPASACKYREWWANENSENTTHVQCKAWSEANYEVGDINLTNKIVTLNNHRNLCKRSKNLPLPQGDG